MGRNFRSPSQATTTSISSFSDLPKREKFRQMTKKNMRSCGKFMYDKERRTFCNKSCKNWCYLWLFYIIFLAILFGLFFGIITLIMYFVRTTRNEPLFCKNNLVPGSSPALGIAPRLPSRVTTMIWYTHKKPTKQSASPEMYISIIDKLLKPYDNLNASLYVDCSKMKRPADKYCSFTREDLGPCGKNGYGYNEDKPCVYLKLNKLSGWRPQYESDSLEQGTENNATNTSSNDAIHILCDGITCFDKEHMGAISFYPGPFFKDYYFPVDNSHDYRSPLIGLQFENLHRGFVIGIKCLIEKRTANLQDEVLHTATAFIYIDSK